MNAVIYLRVSTKEQAQEGYSIAAQEGACVRLVGERGWKLVGAFSDRGESARTVDRPQFKALLDLLKEDRSIRYLVIHKIDRLARNIKDYADIRDLLEKLSVQLVSVTEGLEATASGKMVEGMLAVLAEWYSNNLSAEIRKGQNQKLLEGGWPTMAPIGYRNVREAGPGSRKGKATIIPDGNAHFVLEAFELYGSGGIALGALAMQMHSKGLRNRRGGRVSKSGMWDLLTNPAYVGQVPWKGEVFQGTHEPLVPKEVFEQVQIVLSSHGRSKERQRKHTHFLKGTLSCGTCGRHLLYNIVKNHDKRDFAYYVCASNFTADAKCGEPYFPAAEVESQVESLYRRVKIPPELEKRIEVLLEEEVAQLERGRAHSSQFVARRLQRLANEKDRLIDLYLGGDLERDVFRMRKSRIESEIVDLESKTDGQTVQIKQARELIALAVKVSQNCYAGYRKASPETKKLWNKAMFESITVKNREIVKTVYQEPFKTLLGRKGSNKRNLVDRTGHYSNHLDMLKWLTR